MARSRRRLAEWSGLWYVLASSYLVIRLGVNRLATGSWELGWELLLQVVVVSSIQLALLVAARSFRRTEAGPPGETTDQS